MQQSAVTSSTNASPRAAQPAPLQVELVFRLDLEPEEVFSLVTTRIPEWFTDIHAVRWNHERSRHRGQLGACSERVCDFGGKSLVEEIVEVEPNRRYSYHADLDRSEMKMPLRDHLGTFEVKPHGAGSLVTWSQHFRPAWFVPTALLRWQMRDKMMLPAISRLIEKHGGAMVAVR